VAGSVAVGHAETLAVLVVHQLAAPGAPFIYGTGAGTTFDMRTMVDVWNSPEGALADIVSCQLATLLGLPCWTFAGTSEAKTLDGQWAAQTAVSIVNAIQMGAALLHDAGEYEAGSQNSLESIVFADTVIDYARRLVAGVVVDDETLQLDEIAALGPGGDYLGRRYTRLHHRDLWSSPLFDTATYERWVEGGERTLTDRLHELTLALVARTEDVLSPDEAESLDAFWR
jgi:trimethylamine---corrinoid protein Co-methyltransferase